MLTAAHAAPSYYHHNLSPFVFTTESLPLSGLMHPVGAAVALGILLLGFAVLRKFFTQTSWAPWVMPAWTGFSLFLILMTALKWFGVHWGLRWYSTMYLLGYLFVYVMCSKWIQERRIMLTPMLLDSLIAHIIVGMILGARSFYVFIYNWDSYSKNLGDVFKVWEGGLSFHGGIVGVMIAVTLFCKKNQIPFFHVMDKLAFCVPVGVGLGRIGNFMNGELYGRIIDNHVPWAVIFHIGYAGQNLGGGPQPRHPSQLYQSLGEGWLLFLTLFLISRKKQREGTLSALALTFYSLYRFVVEFFREADAQLSYYFNQTLTMGQILCLIFLLAGLGLFIFTRRYALEGSEAWQDRMNRFYQKREQIEGNL